MKTTVRPAGQDPHHPAVVLGVFLEPNPQLQPSWDLEVPAWGFVWVGWDRLPGCAGRGFTSSCWRRRFPARHRVPRGLRLRPWSRLIPEGCS